MTCIIGLIDNETVYMGGDSAATSGNETRITQEPKVFRRGDLLIGYTTSFRMGQLLHYKLALSPRPEDISDIEYLVTVFAEDVRSCLKAGGFAEIDKNAETGGTFLVGYRGKLYTMDSDYQVLQMGSVNAVGAGREYALGAMAAQEGTPPALRIESSLKIVTLFCNCVCAPFVIESLPKDAE